MRSRAAALAVFLLASCAVGARMTTTASSLRYRTVAEGAGSVARPGHAVRIHETMRLADGTVIYETPKDKPLKFLLGGNQAIAGIDEGVTGMRVGEHRKLIVPPSLSKRSSYPPNVPPDATLYYDVELVEILP